MRTLTKYRLIFFCMGTVFTVLCCEYLIYHVVIMQCDWPELSSDAEHLHVFMLADIHMLGPRKGHWLDKWRREWQMHQAYQTILTLHTPDVVFILGDIFDEGEWTTNKQFKEYVDRFNSLFKVPDGVPLYVVAGNHDIGFHNFIRRGNPDRFTRMMKAPSVQLVTLKGNHFVLINSMAMHGDNCTLCSKAREAVDNVSETLKCYKDKKFCGRKRKVHSYSNPILLQHFPLYRTSDGICNEPDSPPLVEKFKAFIPKRECLSEESTEYLVNKIKPRVVFGGHTHSGCIVQHKYENIEETLNFEEHSIPSFSWRNRPDPKYMLVSITPDEYAVDKCGLPLETTILTIFIMSYMIIIALTISLSPSNTLLRWCRRLKEVY